MGKISVNILRGGYKMHSSGIVSWAYSNGSVKNIKLLLMPSVGDIIYDGKQWCIVHTRFIMQESICLYVQDVERYEVNGY